MITATCAMWFCRVALAVYLIRFQGFGPIAVWIGMFADWESEALSSPFVLCQANGWKTRDLNSTKVFRKLMFF